MFHSHPFHRADETALVEPENVVTASNFGISLAGKSILEDVTLDLRRGEVLGLVGRAGAGKTALLRAMCRLLDETRGVKVRGDMRIVGGPSLYDPACDVPNLRRRIAFMPQEANPFPTSIWDNIAYGARLQRVAMDKGTMADLVEDVLRRCLLWDGLKDSLHRRRGTELPIPQQRLLCIARALAIRPDVLLLDRPSGSIDRMEVDVLQHLVEDLKQDHTLVVVTASLAETAQVADRVAYLDAGRLIEIDTAEMIFTAALHPETRSFIDSTVL